MDMDGAETGLDHRYTGQKDFPVPAGNVRVWLAVWKAGRNLCWQLGQGSGVPSAQHSTESGAAGDCQPGRGRAKEVALPCPGLEGQDRRPGCCLPSFPAWQGSVTHLML